MNILLKKIQKILLLSTICCGLSFSTQIYAAKVDIKKLVISAKKQREKEFININRLVEKAREFTYKNKFSEASDAYQKASNALNKLSGELATFKKRSLAKEMRRFKTRWSEFLMKKARRARLQKKIEDAINFAAEATLIDVNKNAEVSDFIESCKRERKGLEFRNKVKLKNFDKKVITSSKEVEELYKEAEVFYKNKKYAKVRKILENIFLLDPYHKKSIRLLGDTYETMYRYAEKRRTADVQGMLAYNAWKWVDPVLPSHLEIGPGGGETTIQRNIASSTYAKLERIIFPNIEFDDADIFSVIRFLNRLSKRCDPDKVGISVIAGFDKKTADELLKVTMSFSNIPMSEVLRYLCQNVGLKYKIEEGAVILGTSVDEMQTEYFPVRADLIASITGSEDAGEEQADDSEDMELDTENTLSEENQKPARMSLGSQALIKFFEDRGVKFGREASIAYSRRSGKLVVRNTMINLRRLEELLRQYDLINTPLVLIETKIVEIAVTDVEELGFRWDFAFNNSSGADTWKVAQPQHPLRYYQGPEATSTSDISTDALPFKILNDLKILPNFGQGLFPDDITADLSLTIEAIAKNTRTETLSSPKLITTSGHEATIRMVEERYYPSGWENPEITVNNNTVQTQSPIPEFDDSTDIGIKLTVLPIVNPDNYTITLHVKPEIVSFIKFSSYPVSVEQGQIQADGTTKTSIKTTYNILMPEIGRRDIDTHIKVYDGETIVLGGMVNNRNVYRDDKWPILGNVPLIGRFFSSQLALTDSTNLLIFLTARLINNDGVPVRREREQGIPDFYR